MSKKIIIGVIVLMCLSLVGVVGLQLYWISDAIQVKQEQFDRSVNQALTAVVAKLETREALSVVKNRIDNLQPDTSLHHVAQKAQTPPPAEAVQTTENKHTTTAAAPKKAPLQEPQQKEQSILQGSNATSIKGSIGTIHIDMRRTDTAKITGRGALHKDGIEIRSIAVSRPDSTIHASVSGFGSAFGSSQDSVLSFRKTAQRNAGKLFKLSADTLRFSAVDMDSLKVMGSRFDMIKPEDIASILIRKDSVFIVKKHAAVKLEASLKREAATAIAGVGAIKKHVRPAKPVLDTIASYTKPATIDLKKIENRKNIIGSVVKQMVVEYTVKDAPLQQRLDLQALQALLKAELQQQGILLDFGYWVVSGQTDTVTAQNVEAIRKRTLPSYKTSLFPNDIFDKPDYLGLYFPDSKAYALKSLWGMLCLSVLFTLVMIATFGTTIHIIYKQKKLSEMKNDFINNMTHEFKTPIATISLATDSITNPKVFQNPDKIKYYTGIIREENKRMNAQVENVLQIALLEKNEFKMNLQPIDVHELIIKAIEGIRLQVEQRLGQVNVQLDALQHKLPSDEVHLYNVICNLLDNANKYSPKSPDIQLVTKNVNGGIMIAVEDKGIGMSKDTQQRVFEKFYRVPTGNLHNVKGFGLGLSYVKAIVQAHQGDIKLKSELGKGSRFEIFLPIG